MTTRIPKEKSDAIHTFFLPCEFKPKSPLFSVIAPFAYDIKPAFIHGSLGILSYTGNDRVPEAYAVIDTEEASSILLGYILTITEPETVLTLDRIKGYFGPESFNMHSKKLVKAFTSVKKSRDAWCYVLSEDVLEKYQQIEQVEFGFWSEDDETLLKFLEKIGEEL